MELRLGSPPQTPERLETTKDLRWRCGNVREEGEVGRGGTDSADPRDVAQAAIMTVAGAATTIGVHIMGCRR